MSARNDRGEVRENSVDYAESQYVSSDEGESYAVAIIADEGNRRVVELPPEALESPEAAGRAVRNMRSESAVFGLINIEGEYFVILRPGPAGMRMLISDATAAEFDDYAEQVLDYIGIDIPETDPDNAGEVEPWAEGDFEILEDLGLPSAILQIIVDDDDLWADEQVEAIAERLGFEEQLAEILGAE